MEVLSYCVRPPAEAFRSKAMVWDAMPSNGSQPPSGVLPSAGAVPSDADRLMLALVGSSNRPPPAPPGALHACMAATSRRPSWVKAMRPDFSRPLALVTVPAGARTSAYHSLASALFRKETVMLR